MIGFTNIWIQHWALSILQNTPAIMGVPIIYQVGSYGDLQGESHFLSMSGNELMGGGGGGSKYISKSKTRKGRDMTCICIE